MKGKEGVCSFADNPIFSVICIASFNVVSNCCWPFMHLIFTSFTGLCFLFFFLGLFILVQSATSASFIKFSNKSFICINLWLKTSCVLLFFIKFFSAKIYLCLYTCYKKLFLLISLKNSYFSIEAYKDVYQQIFILLATYMSL